MEQQREHARQNVCPDEIRPESRTERNRFQANSNYFTIAVYAIIVIAVGALIVRAVLSFEATVAGVKNLVSVLMPFIIGALLAFIMNPAVRKVMELLDKIGLKKTSLQKGLAIAITYILMLGFLAVVIFGIVPQVINSITDLVNLLPAAVNYVYQFFDYLEERFPNLEITTLEQTIEDTIPSILNSVKNFVADLIPAIYNISVYVVGWIVDIFIALIMSIYILTDKRLLKTACKAFIYAFMPEKRISTVIGILRECNKIFSSFVIGKAIDSLIIGILCFVLMNILRLPYAMLISVIVGITNMIPYFGPFIGAVPGILILLIVSPIKALVFTVLILCLQQFDGLFLGPKILGNSTGLRPLWIIVAITLGGSIGGVLGMFLGVPVMAVLQYLMNRLLRYRLIKRDCKDIDSLMPE